MVFRLDRYLNECDSTLTRKSAKALLHGGCVAVNGKVCKDAAHKVDTECDTVTVNGKMLSYVRFRYFVLNKPAGVLSASRDKKAKTVVDLIDGIGDDCFPVGRLDKDTDGLLLITNDGALAHELLSPKKHVDKTYIVTCASRISEEDCVRLQNGIDLGDFTSAPARVRILDNENNILAMTITEGKFHQVKRMIAAVGSEVTHLTRVRMGGLWLPKDLKHGEYKETDGESLRAVLYPEAPDGEDDEERFLCSYL